MIKKRKLNAWYWIFSSLLVFLSLLSLSLPTIILCFILVGVPAWAALQFGHPKIILKHEWKNSFQINYLKKLFEDIGLKDFWEIRNQ
jgi:hypothetical protein